MTSPHKISISSEQKRIEELEEALREILPWAEAGSFLYERCSASYGDGYTEPRELTIEWQWQQSQPNTSGGGAFFADVDAWIKQLQDDEVETPVIKARAALSNTQPKGE